MALSTSEAAKIVARYARPHAVAETSYATVRDFCDSADHLARITSGDGDLKNVQRPWAVKALLRSVAPPARLLEIGAGEPAIASFLHQLGYDVTVVDPYDGSGRGPVEFSKYQSDYPAITFVRDRMRPRVMITAQEQFDAVFSISVLEHLTAEAIAECFAGIEEVLKRGGVSLHCFDFVARGVNCEHDLASARGILAAQAALSHGTPADVEKLARQMEADVETFYLSPQGHQWWRCGRSYEEFPYRQVASIQTIALKPA
jgi:xanthine/CO dehydrogenase XdhC/CoxF family maturation factor